jgi:hypothetical protein
MWAYTALNSRPATYLLTVPIRCKAVPTNKVPAANFSLYYLTTPLRILPRRLLYAILKMSEQHGLGDPLFAPAEATVEYA